MYCGSNKTALMSQELISRAMMRLIQEKPFTQISVSELCKTAGISRQTFYSLFTSRENVMVFALHARCGCGADPELSLRESGADPRPASREDRLRSLCRGYSQYLYRNRDLIRILAENRIDYLLYDSLYDLFNHADCLFGSLDACARSYASGFYAGGVSCVARQYAREGCAASPQQLEDLLMRLFSGALFE